LRALLGKDVRILRRSPILVAVLVLYPAIIALLIGFALSGSPSRPKVALLDEVPPEASTINFGDGTVNINKYEQYLFQAIDPLRVSTIQQADDAVSSGRVLAALVIPPDIVAKLSSGLQSASIDVVYNGDALKQSFVQSTLEAQLAKANLALSDKLEKVAAQYITLLLDGGKTSIFGGSVYVLGLKASKSILDAAVAGTAPGPERASLQKVDSFAGLAVNNLGLSTQVLTAVSHPIVAHNILLHGRKTPLDTYAVAIAVSISLMFICILLAAGSIALEREDQALGRLLRGLVAPRVLVAEKVLLGALLAAPVAFVLLALISIFVGLDWGRAPLWILGLAVGGLAFAALGTAIGVLAREVRVASLLSFLIALPLAFLALVPSGAVSTWLYDAIRVISAVFPYRATLQAMDNAINQSSPGMAISLVHLVVLTLAFGALARLGLRRLAR
jgi:ABC-type transport system involved in cytochrome c biogenesis permease component